MFVIGYRVKQLYVTCSSVPRQMSLAYNELNGITKSRKSFGLELIQFGNVHYLWAGGGGYFEGAIYFWQVGDL